MFAIPNCDTVKKARTFLDAFKITYEFIDFKKSPPTKEHIKLWHEYLKVLPINTKGTIYKKYKDQFDALNELEKIEFIIANPSIIKRPVLMENDKVLAIGFDEEHYKTVISHHLANH